ncbi:MTOR-associated protein MEAK7-like isoform X2 [Pollicipes pollicipes]|uniref:MTOR-associated protein MEAK7-like isoform X2 n=1 Tax=Pollicipes pollicipes TaxID=41117 RepID=UPI00188583EA|nr:MTOR-associated protein MEAK7-like isoform X2 [Pollicipes pollicipes]
MSAVPWWRGWRAADSGQVELLDLRQYVEKMILSYLQVIKLPTKPNMDSLDRLTAALLGELREKQAANALTQDDIERWLMRSPLFAAVQTNVFRSAFDLDIPHDYQHILPAVRGAPADHASPLGPLEQMFVNHSLPMARRDQWRLLFSTAVHGQSFSKLVGQITDKGPSLVVVRDTDGHVFGGFAPESWHTSGGFYGTSEAFLFSVRPKMEVFLPSGYNENYMYLNVNQQTLPNGLGFGGKFEYFGLFISGDFGEGFTAPTCTTFDLRQMSGRKRFQLDALEVWAVGPEPKKQEAVAWMQ